MLSDFSFMHVLILLLIVLLVFGAKRLPEMGASMGKGIREFKKSLTDVNNQLENPARPDAVPPARDVDAAHTSSGREGEPKKLSQ